MMNRENTFVDKIKKESEIVAKKEKSAKSIG